MDEKSAVANGKREPKPGGRSNGLLSLGLIVLLLLAIGGAGFYLDWRLTSLEEKVLTQTSGVSRQTESTLQALQDARKDILGNRQEAAAFAQKFYTTLDQMSALLTQTVNAFSEQTIQLTKAIEQKDKSQSESMNAALAALTREAASTREAALQTANKTESVDRRLAQLNDRLQELNQGISEGFVTLTQLSREMSEAVSAHLDRQKESLNSQLAELRDASAQSLDSVHQQLAALEQGIQEQKKSVEQISTEKLPELSGKMEGLANSTMEKTNAVHDSLARHIDGIVDIAQNQSRETGEMSASISRIAENLDALSGNIERDFAAGKEGQDALRTHLAELNDSLNGCTENLLVELTALQQASDENAVTERLQGVENRLDAAAKNLQVLQTGLGSQLADAAQTAIAKGFESLNGASNGQSSQTIFHLKALSDRILILQESVQNGIKAARNKAADLLQNPQSDDAKKAFEAGILEFAETINAAQTQVEDIQKQISSLVSQLSQRLEESPVESKPIGMVETSDGGAQ